MTKLKSHTKNSTETINKLSIIQDQVSGNVILIFNGCTFPLYKHYQRRRHSSGQGCIKGITNSITNKDNRNLTVFNSLNNFIFNGIHLQRMGCAMGTKCSPSYDNLFMGKFEELYTYPWFLNKSWIYLRYIDELFFIWTGIKQELKQFFQEFNKVCHTIKFEYKF